MDNDTWCGVEESRITGKLRDKYINHIHTVMHVEVVEYLGEQGR